MPAVVWQVKLAAWVVTMANRRTQTLSLACGGSGRGTQCGPLISFFRDVGHLPQICNFLGF